MLGLRAKDWAIVGITVAAIGLLVAAVPIWIMVSAILAK
jgi:hypothetical protein